MIGLGLDEWFCDMKILECYTGMIQSNHLQTAQRPMYLMMSRASFASEASTAERNPTGYWLMCWNCFLRLFLKLVWWSFALNLLNAEAVKELYDKMLDSVVVKRSMPPNAWLWSLLEKCKNHDDIKLLFDILEKLRRFVSFCCFLIITPFIIFNLIFRVSFLGKVRHTLKGSWTEDLILHPIFMGGAVGDVPFELQFIASLIYRVKMVDSWQLYAFGCRDFQIFVFMRILIAICAEKLLRHVLM